MVKNGFLSRSASSRIKPSRICTSGKSALQGRAGDTARPALQVQAAEGTNLLQVCQRFKPSLTEMVHHFQPHMNEQEENK